MTASAGDCDDSPRMDELTLRIELLEAEIARVRAHHGRVAKDRAAAEALFRPRETD